MTSIPKYTTGLNGPHPRTSSPPSIASVVSTIGRPVMLMVLVMAMLETIIESTSGGIFVNTINDIFSIRR